MNDFVLFALIVLAIAIGCVVYLLSKPNRYEFGVLHWFVLSTEAERTRLRVWRGKEQVAVLHPNESELYPYLGHLQYLGWQIIQIDLDKEDEVFTVYMQRRGI